MVSGLKAQHRSRFLGYFWWLLDPLLGVLIYYFVVAVVFRRGGEGYIITLTIGLTVWRWFHASIGTGARSIAAQGGIITQVYLPKAIFPVTAVLSQLINFVFGLVVVGALIVLLHRLPGPGLLWLPYIMASHLLFTVALALPLAYFFVFVRDMDNALDHVMRLWFYASPVIWSEAAIPAKWQFVLHLNPMAHYLAAYRRVLMGGGSPDYVSLFVWGIASALAIAGAIYFFSKNEHRIIKAL